MNFLKGCFEPNHQATQLISQIYEKQQQPHQRLYREQGSKQIQSLQLKKTEDIANRLEVRGGWHHRNQDIDYREIAWKQQKYREFINERRSKIDKWNECFEEDYK